MIKNELVDVAIVGGGQSGISLSYYLCAKGINHIVLDRDCAFSAWRNRWDGFRVNTPNWMNTLPMLDGTQYPSQDKKGFATKDEMVAYLDDCLNSFDAPVKTDTHVRKVIQQKNGKWSVQTDNIVYAARNVAICVGAMSAPKVPALAGKLPSSVSQLHSSEYRSPNQIRAKSVLLVGSGSSGMQICRLLIESGRFEKVGLATSDVLVLPPKFLGIQIHRFLHLLGLFDVRKDSILGKLMYSKLETKGDPIMPPSPQDLSRRHGASIYGRLVDLREYSLVFADAETIGTDDLTIIWCTGFGSDYSFIETYIPNTAFDQFGRPKHKRGVIDAAPGLYFVGLRYQHTVASHDIYGVAKDAKFVADQIASRLGQQSASPASEMALGHHL